ncbi:DNA cytosine methyltransferase [Dictyobacter formicarum]|nr:DNA cytosine methyltransferase [Dictyobacter formicarum]
MNIKHVLHTAHFFAGAGGDMCGLSLAGWVPHFAVEVNPYRCKTLRHNFPSCTVHEGPIQQLMLADYPPGSIPLFFVTFPCDHYTLAANMHGTWTGDALYLEALREIVLRFPEIIILENVLGMRKFRRVMETFRALPLYYCTEVVLYGEDFTLQRKARVFLILHRQPFDFDHIAQVQLARPGQQLAAYLEKDEPLHIPQYVYKRLDGEYRDPPKIYDPQQEEPVNLFANYGRDRSLFLVRDRWAPRGVRPFSVRECANLHRFPRDYRFVGPLGESYDMVIDSVMPAMAYALGHAARRYFMAIRRLATVPQPHGYREIADPRRREEEMGEALRILHEPDPLPKDLQQLVLW